MRNIDPVILLIGGKGSRMDNINKKIQTPPKALTKINSHPLILHTMNNFINYGYKNFIFALGHKGYMLKDYFEKRKMIFNKKIKIFSELRNYNEIVKNDKNNIKIFLMNTGINSNKTQRVSKILKNLNVKEFIVNYGDGVGNINLQKMKVLHSTNKYLCTCASFIPNSQYGHFVYKNNKVVNFIEKPKLNNRINIGYFFFKIESLKFINKYLDIDLEAGVLKNLALNNSLQTYLHTGFWKSVDTLKDANELSQILKNDKK